MTEEPKLTGARLLDELALSWAALDSTLDSMATAQLTGPSDAAGWTVTDHLSHLIAWNDWVIALLDGTPGWEALGISEALFREADDDAANEIIRQRYAGQSPAVIRANLLLAHSRIVDRVAAMSDTALAAPFRPLRDDEPPDRVIPPIANVIYGSSAEHYLEHLEWIQTLAGNAGPKNESHLHQQGET